MARVFDVAALEQRQGLSGENKCIHDRKSFAKALSDYMHLMMSAAL